MVYAATSSEVALSLHSSAPRVTMLGFKIQDSRGYLQRRHCSLQPGRRSNTSSDLEGLLNSMLTIKQYLGSRMRNKPLS